MCRPLCKTLVGISGVRGMHHIAAGSTPVQKLQQCYTVYTVAAALSTV